jgi:hypothetical protein
MLITEVMLLYNTEWWYYHGMVVNYRGKKSYNIGPLDQYYKLFTAVITPLAAYFSMILTGLRR